MALLAKQNSKQKIKAEISFRSNPYKFAAKLFDNSQFSGKPTFSADEAQQYFKKTYRDEDRDYVYCPSPGLQRPDIRHIFFCFDAQLRMRLKGVSEGNEMELLLV